mgnify:CR=1 FL=1
MGQAGFEKMIQLYAETMASENMALEEYKNEQLKSPEFVFMFIPIEGVFSLLIKEFPELNKQEGAAMTLWFRVEHIFEWYEEIKNKTEIIRPFGITSYNGANEFVIRDINGFILHFSNFDLYKALNELQLETLKK